MDSSWRCGATKIEFRGPATESKQSADPQQIVVDGVATKIWNVRTWFADLPTEAAS